MGGKRVTTEIYMEDVKEIHKDKGYEYKEDWEYTSSKCPIEVKCPTHGWWTTRAYSHRGMKSGCPRCAEDNRDQMSYEKYIRDKIKQEQRELKLEEEYLKALSKRYGNLDLSNTVYIPGCLLRMKCKVHGNTIFRMPRDMRSNSGCKLCGEEARDFHNDAARMTTEDAIERFIEAHGNRYDYSNVVYKGAVQKVEVICREHGSFWILPGNHYRAFQSGCPDCAVSGYKRSLPGILYYLKIPCRHRDYYKIGITNNTVKQRFSRDSGRYLIIKEWYYEDGGEAYDEEQRILKEFSEYKCSIEDIDFDWVSGGTTEMFTRDVLNLDNMYAEYLK